MIHLISTVEEHRLDWIPQFVDHYQRLGVERFLISLHVGAERTPEDLHRIKSRAQEILAKREIALEGILHCSYDSILLCNYHNAVRLLGCREEDWIVWADIDEFQDYPDGLRETLAACERHGYGQVQGRFIDRLARNGELAPFDPERPIWDQYPIGANVTEAILGGLASKVVASRAGLQIGLGHHCLVGEPPAVYPGELSIHHFKWDKSVIKRLVPRLEEDFRKRCPWWTETKRFYDHIVEHGRIRLDGLNWREIGSAREKPIFPAPGGASRAEKSHDLRVHNLKFETYPVIVHAHGGSCRKPLWKNLRREFFMELSRAPRRYTLPEELTIVTWNTAGIVTDDPRRGFKEPGMMEFCLRSYGVPCRVLTRDLRKPWKHALKIEILLDALDEVKTSLVAGLDSYDVIVAGDPGELARRFERDFDCDLLFGAEYNCWPRPTVPEIAEAAEFQKGQARGGVPYLQAGMWIGRIETCREFFEAAAGYDGFKNFPADAPLIPPDPSSSEQCRAFMIFERFHPRVQIDHRCAIFQSLTCEDGDIELRR